MVNHTHVECIRITCDPQPQNNQNTKRAYLRRISAYIQIILIFLNLLAIPSRKKRYYLYFKQTELDSRPLVDFQETKVFHLGSVNHENMCFFK